MRRLPGVASTMNTRMKTQMRTLGIILARTGSAGLADKHLRSLCGRPVIDYTFDHALASDRLTTTVLSTDCPRLTLMALARGIRVIQRPPELATSTASVQDAMLHAMETFQTNGGFAPEALVVIYGNVPIRPPEIFDSAIEHLEE